MRLRILMSLAALLMVQASGLHEAVAQQQQNAAELAKALQRKYDTVRDFSADFTQTYRGGVLKRQMTESGRVLVKKPGRMRWEYKTPEEKLFVSDGAKVFWYVPQDKQVIVSLVPQDDRASTPALFLAGKGDITRDFIPSLVESPAGQPEGARALKLVPQKAPAGVRLAHHLGRPRYTRVTRLGDRRCPGRHVELFLRKPEGKRQSGR